MRNPIVPDRRRPEKRRPSVRAVRHRRPRPLSRSGAPLPLIAVLAIIGLGAAAGLSVGYFFGKDEARTERSARMIGPAMPPAEREASPEAGTGRRATAAPPPWRLNAAVAPVIGRHAVIAIVIDDLGLDPAKAEAAAALPPPLTLSFLPYGRNLQPQADRARRRGHEIMLHLPMEPSGPDDPGPNALLTRLGRDELLRRLDWNLARLSGYVGVNNHMGSRFTESARSLEPVLEAIRDRGLLFLDSRTSARSAAEAISRALGLPTAARDVFLDDDRSRPAIEAELARLERIARKEGSAIAIGHPYPETLAALAAWIPEAKARGIVLAPLSALVEKGLASTRAEAETPSPP